MKKWRLIFDVGNCQDCNNCLLACKDEHTGNDWPGYTASQPRHGHRWIDIERTERGQFPLVDVAYVQRACMHCDDAPCVKQSGGAIYRRKDGIVVIDPKKAKGRTDLAATCPYGRIGWNEEEKVAQKCTMCAHLLDDGWTQTRCSQACPTGSIRLEFIDDAQFARLAKKEGLEPLNPEFGTSPRVYYKDLYRYDKCFIAGTVAAKKAGLTDCVKGAKVRLVQGGKKIAEAETDAYGDFRFDRLEAGLSECAVEVAAPGRKTQTVEIGVLGASRNVGTVLLS